MDSTSSPLRRPSQDAEPERPIQDRRGRVAGVRESTVARQEAPHADPLERLGVALRSENLLRRQAWEAFANGTAVTVPAAPAERRRHRTLSLHRRGSTPSGR